MKGKLEFCILRCLDFEPNNYEGVDDTELYVKLAFNGKFHSTQKIDIGKNLEWNYFNKIDSDNRVKDDDKVHFSLHFQSPKADILVGTKVMSLRHFFDNSISERKIELIDKDENFVGNLIVQCNWFKSELLSKETDFIGRNLVNLTGPRPHILRIESYYTAFKNVYFAIAGFPIINKVSPVFENVIEGILQKTPLNVKSDESPEKGDEKVRIVDNVDKAIDSKLDEVDMFFDDSKDKAIQALCDVKNAIKGIKPKDKSIVEATIDGVSYTANASKNLVVDTVSGTISGISGFIGSIFGKAKETSDKTSEVVSSKTQEVSETAAETISRATEMAQKTAEDVSKSSSEMIAKARSNAEPVKDEIVKKFESDETQPKATAE